MKLLFVHSHVFKYTEDGTVYSEGQFPYNLLKNRYLLYFDEIVVSGRGEKIKCVNNLSVSSGPNVKHHILPNLSTIKNRNQRIKELKKDLIRLIKQTDIVVARLPSVHAYFAIKIARALNKPYVIEVVGDAFNSLWTHGNILGKILAPIYYVKNRRVIKKSPYLIYVTKKYLQGKYPYNKNALTINASNVNISYTFEDVLVQRINKINKISVEKEIKIGLIGSYSSKYKGIDTAIKSIKKLRDKGLNCILIVVGSGKKQWLINLAQKLEVRENIVFMGTLPGGEDVLNWLDKLDVYIQPSLTEGLPRALIEAMSRGLPCVGSSAGGIPELLEKRFIHPPKSDKELSRKIEYILSKPNVMIEQAERNFSKAKEYTSDVLNIRRKKFWSEVINKELEI